MEERSTGKEKLKMEEVKCSNKKKIFFVMKNLTICFMNFCLGSSLS